MSVAQKLAVILPAHDEEAAVGRTMEEIRSALPDADIIVIDDASTDATARIAEAAGARVIRLLCNLGIAGARETGYRYARLMGYDLVVQMDADGQHDPAYAAAVLEPVRDGALDMCIGSRFLRPDEFREPALRRAGIAVIRWMIRSLTGQRISDPTSGFRAVNGRVIGLYQEGYPYEYPEPEEIVYLRGAGCRIGEVPVRMRERRGGKSFVTPLVSVYYMCEVALALVSARLRKPPAPRP